MAEDSALPVDPQRSLKRSLDQLNQSIKAMSKHLESLEAKGQGQYIEGQKESLRDSRGRFQSAQPSSQPKQPQLFDPGAINEGASTIPEVIAQMKNAGNSNQVEKEADTVLKAGELG